MTAATAIAILWTQSAHCAWFAAGAVGSTVVSESPFHNSLCRPRTAPLTLARIIKRTIRQPRPPPPPPSTKPAPVRPKRTYGMPSTHSTALGFYFAYMWPLLPLVSGVVWGERVAVAAITGLTLWSRVELGYHTVPQVVAGTTVGVICAAGWKALWDTNPVIEAQLQALMDTVREKALSFF